MRFSACCQTALAGPSMTPALTSSPRWAGRQCRNMASGAAPAHQGLVDLVAGEGVLALALLRLPGPSRSTRRCTRRRRRPTASPGRSVRVTVGAGGAGPVDCHRVDAGARAGWPAGRRSRPARRPGSGCGRRCCRRRPTPRCGPPGCPQRWRRVSRSASAWQGWARSESRLTMGTSSTAAMRFEHGVVEDAGPDDAVVASQDPGDVLDALAVVDADLVAPDGDGVAAEADDRHLGGVAGPGRRLLEDERHAPARRGPGSGVGSARPGRAPPSARPGSGRRSRGSAASAAAPTATGAARIATASSISSSLTSSDGASRNAVGVTALTTRPASRAAAATGPAVFPLLQLGGDQQSQAPHRCDARQLLEGGHQVRAPASGPGPGRPRPP